MVLSHVLPHMFGMEGLHLFLYVPKNDRTKEKHSMRFLRASMACWGLPLRPCSLCPAPESHLGTTWTLTSILPAALNNLTAALGSRICHHALIVFAQPSNARLWETEPRLRLGFLTSKQAVISGLLHDPPCPQLSAAAAFTAQVANLSPGPATQP